MTSDNIELANPQIMTIAAIKLGGALTPIDFEDLAIEAFEIAPSRFCWKKYPDRIDLRIVHYALQSATRLTPPLIEGNMKQGYMLTPEGIEWVESLGDLKASQIVESYRKASQQELTMLELARLRNSQAFRKWVKSNKNEISLRDFQEFARVNEYFTENLRDQRYLRLKNVVQGDPDLEKLLKYLLKTFEGAK